MSVSSLIEITPEEVAPLVTTRLPLAVSKPVKVEAPVTPRVEDNVVAPLAFKVVNAPVPVVVAPIEVKLPASGVVRPIVVLFILPLVIVAGPTKLNALSATNAWGTAVNIFLGLISPSGDIDTPKYKVAWSKLTPWLEKELPVPEPKLTEKTPSLTVIALAPV